jgi:hypothetical protein
VTETETEEVLTAIVLAPEAPGAPTAVRPWAGSKHVTVNA